MRKGTKILLGLILVALGVILGLNVMGITHIDLLFDGWWTLFIIVPCFVGLFSPGDKTGNLIGLLVGVFLLLCAQDVLDYAMLWKLALPVIVVLIGLRMIFGSFRDPQREKVIRDLEASGKPLKNGFAAFSGTSLNFNGEPFEGAELTAVFGGVKCDLRGAVMNSDVVIKASAVFGGIDLIVPEGVEAKVQSLSIFGGVSNKHPQPTAQSLVTVYVDATCVFGGMDIQ